MDKGYKEAKAILKLCRPAIQVQFASALDKIVTEDMGIQIVLPQGNEMAISANQWLYVLTLVRSDFINTHPQYIHQGRIIPFSSNIGHCTYYMQIEVDEAAAKHSRDLRYIERFCRNMGELIGSTAVKVNDEEYYFAMVSEYNLEIFERDYGYYYVIPVPRGYLHK